MSFTTTRQATETDELRLNAAATRFITNHAEELPYAAQTMDQESYLPLLAYNAAYDHDQNNIGARKLLPLWRAAARRALQSKTDDAIAYGYVGHSVE